MSADLEQQIKSQRQDYDKRIEEMSVQLKEVAARSGEQMKKSDFDTFKEVLELKVKAVEDESSKR